MRFRSRRRLVLAAWPLLIALAAGSARGQTVQGPDGEAPGAGPPAPALPAPAVPAAPPTVRRPRLGLAIAGAALFTATWVPTVILSRYGDTGCDDERCRNSYKVVWLPVAGPLLAYNLNSNVDVGLVVLWTLAEAAGLVMLVAGLYGRRIPAAPAPGSSWRITPATLPGGAGLSFGATF